MAALSPIVEEVLDFVGIEGVLDGNGVKILRRPPETNSGKQGTKGRDEPRILRSSGKGTADQSAPGGILYNWLIWRGF